MFPPFHFLQRLPIVSFLLLHSLHLLHLFIFFTTPLSFLSTKTSLPSFFSSHLLTLILSDSLIFSLSFIISFNGTQGQEILLRPIFLCPPSHPLEWSHKVGGTSSIDIPARESHSHGWICKFFIFFFSLSGFPLIFGLNVFLTMWMLGFCYGMGLDENLMS